MMRTRANAPVPRAARFAVQTLTACQPLAASFHPRRGCRGVELPTSEKRLDETPPRERKTCPHEEHGGQRGEARHGLTDPPVHLSGMDEAQPSARPTARRHRFDAAHGGDRGIQARNRHGPSMRGLRAVPGVDGHLHGSRVSGRQAERDRAPSRIDTARRREDGFQRNGRPCEGAVEPLTRSARLASRRTAAARTPRRRPGTRGRLPMGRRSRRPRR